jgi:mono/diheme cytochrome c family protein
MTRHPEAAAEGGPRRATALTLPQISGRHASRLASLAPQHDDQKFVPLAHLCSALVLLIGLSSAFAEGAQPNEAEIDQGREVYGDFCLTCHGRDMINPGGVTFDLRKFPKDDFERFRNAVLNGKPPAMPGWRDKISDEDLKSLWAYVRSGG